MVLNRSAEQVQKFAYAIVGFVFFIGGGLFAWYVWNGTNVKQDQEDAPAQSIRGDIKLKPAMAVAVEERPGQGLVAVVTLTNDTPARMIMPETVIPEPLYGLVLKYGPKGAPAIEPVPPFSAGNNDSITVMDAVPTIAFDPKHDAVIELLPAHSHSLTIPLQSKFRFLPGNYELSVKFQPLSIEATDDSKLPNFNVGVSVEKAKFTVPLGGDKSSEAPEQPPEKTPKSAVKTQAPPAPIPRSPAPPNIAAPK